MMKPQYNLLNVIPYKAEHIITEKKDGLIILAYPRFKKEWVSKLILPKKMSSHIHICLEEHGTAVWELIDGNRTVEEIINMLSEHFAGEDNYESRVTTFIIQLQKDKFIKYRIKN